MNPFIINIGVSGHRDLRHEDKKILSGIVHGIFENLNIKCSNARFILFSPLAEGADRLVAEVALEMGFRLTVPLPFSQEEYEKDFCKDGSREEFLLLLKQADRTLTLPLVERCTKEKIRSHGKYRDLQYDQASAYIVSCCPIIIVLWDGKEKNHVSKVIRWHKAGLPEPFASNFLQDSAPVKERILYHIVTPRISNLSPPDVFSVKQKIFG